LPDRLRPAGAGGLSLLRRERSPVRCRGRSRAAGGRVDVARPRHRALARRSPEISSGCLGVAGQEVDDGPAGLRMRGGQALRGKDV
jgi:hypothetical protein